jgi:hypothetical protein
MVDVAEVVAGRVVEAVARTLHAVTNRPESAGMVSRRNG